MIKADNLPIVASHVSNTTVGFEIISLSVLLGNSKNRNKSEVICNSYFNIIWNINGTGTYWIDLHKHNLVGNKIICLKPGQPHRLHFKKDSKSEGFIFRFEKSFLNMDDQELDLTYATEFFKLFSFSNGMDIEEGTTDELKDLVKFMQKELDLSIPLKTAVLKRYFEIFILKLTSQSNKVIEGCLKTKNMELVEEFMDLVDKNFKEMKMVGDYASRVGITPNYLNEIVKKITGKSASYQIRHRIVIEAKRQAIYSKLCMKEVAYYLGFSDPGHFSKFFKNTTGKNFSDFKQQVNIGTPFEITYQNVS
ncbi:MAG: helix-turn-helix domain-containing protein [Sediminicola sp.]